ncbi:MAG: hypothetical protein E7109_08720 [Bacteroidales bacterium]|nr:hypothetical protein [Bacteroidales bacterium]
MASSFKCIYNYPETLLDTLCQWNDTILAGNLDNTATNFTDAVRATGSSDRSRAKEMYRIGLLCLELTKGETGLDHIKAGKNAQSDLGFISSIITKAKQAEDTDSLRLAYSALCSIYSLLQSVTIGRTEISVNALIYRLNNIYPCPADIDFIKWHRYVLSAFLCELKYREYLYSKNPTTNPIPSVFEDTLSGKNTSPFSMSIRTNEFKGLTLRKTIQSVSDVRDAIDTRVSLTDIFQQKMPLFMFGNDSDVIPKGFYGMANKYFSAFLKAAFVFEVSDPSRPSKLELLFDEESTDSAKTDALKAIIDIFETVADTSLITEYNRLMKTIYQGAKDALRILRQDSSQLQDGPATTIQKIFYGCPGTGKSRTIKDMVEGEEGEKIVYFDENGVKIQDINTVQDKSKLTCNIFRTTFHPDYDYTTFVGAYKPVMNPVLDANGNDTGNEELAYEFVPQVFTNAYVRAWKSLSDDTLSDAEKQVYLIIEEINRGNCAQIFGDLFQLLDRKKGESEFSIIPDAELRKHLAKEGLESNKLVLPKNLHILATMNTSDQSLFPMDSAFKRRWAMEYVPIKLDHPVAKKYTFKVNGKEYTWVDFLRKVNPLIRKATDSEDKQMGEFFIKGDISEEDFKNKVMFYIWNDVCKDLYSASRISPLYFMRSDASEGNKNVFTFAELYGKGRFDEEENKETTPTELLEGFITQYLKLEPKVATVEE